MLKINFYFRIKRVIGTTLLYYLIETNNAPDLR
jgi:hypothetical protein